MSFLSFTKDGSKRAGGAILNATWNREFEKTSNAFAEGSAGRPP